MQITKPTLLLDTTRVFRNIDRMTAKARTNQVRFRPHFKTHQSAQIGEWFRARGVHEITVSSVEMAAYFARHQWQDITIAFPVNLREIDQINALANTISLNLLVESEESVKALEAHLLHPVNVWMKIDVGYHRTGLPWNDAAAISRVAQVISQAERLTLQGLLTHSGHTYKARSIEAIQTIYRETVTRMNHARASLASDGFSPLEISVGDTPACSVVDDFSEVDEIRPGNFVFYDAMQLHLGSCAETDIAVAVACPVVAKHRDRGEIVIYGGAVHLSKESLVQRIGSAAEETQMFGAIALPEGAGWGPLAKKSYVAGLSQEHGIVKTEATLLEQIHIGDLLFVIPVHSCLTANLLRKYYTPDGECIKLADLS